MKKKKKIYKSKKIKVPPVTVDPSVPSMMQASYSELGGFYEPPHTYEEYLVVSPVCLGVQSCQATKQFFLMYLNSVAFLSHASVTLDLKVDYMVIHYGGDSHIIIPGGMSGPDLKQTIINTLVLLEVFGPPPLKFTDEYTLISPSAGPPVFFAQDTAVPDTKEVTDMVAATVLGKKGGSAKDLGKTAKFYEIVEGTSSGSRYVVVAHAKEGTSNIAMRYTGTTLSLRCDPAPSDPKVLDTLIFLGFTESAGSHVSCHLGVQEGVPMDRFLILMKAVLKGSYDLCDMDMGIIKAKGA